MLEKRNKISENNVMLIKYLERNNSINLKQNLLRDSRFIAKEKREENTLSVVVTRTSREQHRNFPPNSKTTRLQLK